MNGLTVSPSPHRSSDLTTAKIMGAVIAALLPAAIAGCTFFGVRAALVLIVTVASSVAFEALFNVIVKKEQTVSDLSAALTGLLLGMNFPAAVPLYVPVIGSFIAIVIVKQLFGGIGQNFANPAITARIVLMVSFTGSMTKWVTPYWYRNASSISDALTGATPLAAGWLDDKTGNMISQFTFDDMFLGTTGGCIGETCAAALILGGIALIAFKIISPATPIAYIGTFALFTLLYSGSGAYTAYQLLAGGLMLGAFFMATDYATTPLTTKGKVIFGIGCGIITFVIRTFGSYPEGVSFSILLMNLLTPYIDKLCRTSPLGGKKPVKEKKAPAGTKKEDKKPAAASKPAAPAKANTSAKANTAKTESKAKAPANNGSKAPAAGKPAANGGSRQSPGGNKPNNSNRNNKNKSKKKKKKR